jgi:hypothetical protein
MSVVEGHYLDFVETWRKSQESHSLAEALDLFLGDLETCGIDDVEEREFAFAVVVVNVFARANLMCTQDVCERWGWKCEIRLGNYTLPIRVHVWVVQTD